MDHCWLYRCAAQSSVLGQEAGGSRHLAEGAIQNILRHQKHGHPRQQPNETPQKSKDMHHGEATEWYCSRVCICGANSGNSTRQVGTSSFSGPFPPKHRTTARNTRCRHHHFTTRSFLTTLYIPILGKTNGLSISIFVVTFLVSTGPIYGRNPTSTSTKSY